MTFELYHTLYSTCSQKVRMALFEKGLEWKSREIDLVGREHLSEEYRALNPSGVVPTLKHDGKVITESSVIIEYLDDLFPDPPLAPRDPYGKAKLRAWICFINEFPTAYIRYPTFHVVIPLLVKGVRDEDRLAEADRRGARKYLYRKATAEGLSDKDMIEGLDVLRATVLRVDKALSEKDGGWIMGHLFSLAECAITPTFDRMEDLGMAQMWSDRPQVADWWARIKQRPSFAKSYPAGSRVSEAIPNLREKRADLLADLLDRTGRKSLRGDS